MPLEAMLVDGRHGSVVPGASVLENSAEDAAQEPYRALRPWAITKEQTVIEEAIDALKVRAGPWGTKDFVRFDAQLQELL